MIKTVSKKETGCEEKTTSLMVHRVRTGIPSMHHTSTLEATTHVNVLVLSGFFSHEGDVFISSSVLQTYSVTDTWCSTQTVLLSYTVLQTDSVAAQAVVTKAEGERGRCSAVSMTTGGVACQAGAIDVATR